MSATNLPARPQIHRANRSSLPPLLVYIGLACLLLLVGCKKAPSAPTPTPTQRSGLPQVVSSTLPPRVVTATAAAAATLGTILPPAPAAAGTPGVAIAGTPGAAAVDTTLTPTPCPIPAGWIVYTILPGDTLFSLARTTGSTVDEIKAANCKTDDALIAYEDIHLKRRPPAPVAVAAVPQGQGSPKSGQCESAFNCNAEQLPSLDLAFGGGNLDPTIPCIGLTGQPRIESPVFNAAQGAPASTAVPPTWRMGNVARFYACDFSHPDQLKASISGPGKSANPFVEDVNLQSIPNETQRKTKASAQKVIAWYPECSLPSGIYTLTVSDGTNSQSYNINLATPNQMMMMVRPEGTRKGKTADFFFCGYTASANQSVQFDLYRLKEKVSDFKYEYSFVNSFYAAIDSKGNAVQSQAIPVDAAEGLYFIQDHPDELRGELFFYIVP